MTKEERLNIQILLLKNFHSKIKPGWLTLEDFKIKGDEWVKSIESRYDDSIITLWAKEFLLEESYSFHTKNTPLTADDDFILIMKGGGIKGLAYVGALQELEKFYSFNWYAGTSAGAIAAILLAAGYTNKELKQILEEKNFSEFMDANLLKACWNFITKRGLFEGKNFTNWMDFLLSKKLDSPTRVKLLDLPYRATVCASRKNKSALIFDSHDEQYKHRSAAFAARCSMSIPYVFIPERDEGHNVFDGGIQNNFPVEKILERKPNAKFIGLYLGPEHYEGQSNQIFFDLKSIWMESNDIEALEKHKENIIVIDPRPIKMLNFNLSLEKKEFLLENGRLAALKFLDLKGKLNKEDYKYSERKKLLEAQRKKLS